MTVQEEEGGSSDDTNKTKAERKMHVKRICNVQSIARRIFLY